MFASIPIGSILGVKIRVHLLFLILIAFLILTEWDAIRLPMEQRVLFLGILWLSVLAHELGHSLVARRLKVHVIDITFWPLGGMARFADFPTDPKIELPIAIAGPAVNFALALLFLPFVTNGPHWAEWAWWINLALGTFNLVPAFPMDGGRVLRSVLAFRLPFLRATEIAVSLGRSLALLLIATAFFVPQGLMLALVAVFIWLSGTQELWSVRLRHATQTGNPFVFWKSFQFGGKSRGEEKNPPQPRIDSKETQKDLESFKGDLREFFGKEKDPDGS